MSQHDRYISPFSTRYSSDEMQYIFSDDNKFRTWRRLWIALAKAEQKQGLAITDEQIAELEAHKDDINYEDAIAREKLVRHDVMSHVYAYGLQCPKQRASSIWARPAAMSVTTPTSSSCARACSSCARKSSACWQIWPSSPTSTRPCPAWPTPTASPRS